MSIPAYDTMFQPLLTLLNAQRPIRKSELLEPLARHFSLSDEELQRTYESKNARIFEDRMSWALSYLSMAGLLERPARAQYLLTRQGSEYAQKSGPEVKAHVKQQVSQRQKQHDDIETAGSAQAVDMPSDQNSQSPAEALEESYKQILESRYDEILETILGKTPTAFEKLVVELLQKMGYGGAVKDAGTVTPASRDGGIDGVIREDVLGLGRIYIQAKRYHPDNSIQRDQIQTFVGALQGHKASKGVFITTSSYSPGAQKYVTQLANQHVVLIDGRKLAGYIYEYGVGMQTRQTLELKELDGNFWERFDDAPSKTPDEG